MDTVKKKTASAFLKQYGLTVGQAEQLFSDMFDALEKNQQENEQEKKETANRTHRRLIFIYK